MSDEPTRVTVTVTAIDRFRLGNGRDIAVLNLGIPYLEAAKLSSRGMALQAVIDGKTAAAELAFVNPLDAPAIVSVDASDAENLSEGDQIELVVVAK